MASILRSSRLSLRASYSPFIRPASRLTSTSKTVQPWRGYAHSSYGGEGETQAEQPNTSRNEPTRDLEHPGPPAPDVGGSSKKSQQSSNNSGSKDTGHGTGTGVESKSHSKTTPSNKAKPTITDGENSPNAEIDGTVGDNASEDVKRHNQEMDQRYDHAYNQVKK